jgi:hypothetical protein
MLVGYCTATAVVPGTATLPHPHTSQTLPSTLGTAQLPLNCTGVSVGCGIAMVQRPGRSLPPTEGRERGKEGRREGGTEGRRDGGTEGRRDGGTEGRRDGGTEGVIRDERTYRYS